MMVSLEAVWHKLIKDAVNYFSTHTENDVRTDKFLSNCMTLFNNKTFLFHFSNAAFHLNMICYCSHGSLQVVIPVAVSKHRHLELFATKKLRGDPFSSNFNIFLDVHERK